MPCSGAQRLTIETSRRHWNWWGSAELCKFVLKKRSHASRLGAIRDIMIDDVIGHTRGTSTIVGHPDQPIEHLRVSNVTIDMLPENAPDKRATHAIVFEQVRDLRVRDLAVRWSGDQGEPKWQSALVLRRVTDFVLHGFDGRQGNPAAGAPAILLDQAVQGEIVNARGSAGCRRLIHVQGEATREVTVKDSRVPGGASAVTFENDAVRRAVRVS